MIGITRPLTECKRRKIKCDRWADFTPAAGAVPLTDSLCVSSHILHTTGHNRVLLARAAEKRPDVNGISSNQCKFELTPR